MKDNVLNAALREVVSREFADIPQHENEIAYKFSDDFTRRMDKSRSFQIDLWECLFDYP